MLEKRHKISISRYETIFQQWTNSIVNDIELDVSNDLSRFVLSGVKNNQRIYLERG